ncbi:MAG: ATP-dependent helicase, partial [Chloroflexi bacterium]|nr:ATP-dependent helicase [Chloroflexota bacterium]
MSATSQSADWSNGLLPQQARAASYSDGHARLLAGPGTGKTLTLTGHTVYLINEKKIAPNRILALTFTRAAAQELRGRVEAVVGKEHLPKISTLHSFALQQLIAAGSSNLSLPRPVRIADDWEEQNIIRRDLSSTLGATPDQIEDLYHRMSSDWESLSAESDQWEQVFPDASFLGAWRQHRDVYGYTLRSELVYQLKRTLDNNPLGNIGQDFDHVLVDEYQDLNRCDLAIIRHFANRGATILAAGDDDQSIYGFRMAHPEGIRRFLDEYDDAERLDLEICMRCDQTILALGRFVAEQDPDRTHKDLVPRQDSSSGVVSFLQFHSQRAEAAGIAKVCRTLLDSGQAVASDLMILLRSDSHGGFSKVIVEALQDHGVPVTVGTASTDILDERSGRIVLAWLRLLADSKDHLSWRTIIQETTSNRLGAGAIQAIFELATDRGRRFSEAVKLVADEPSCLPRYGNRVKSEYDRIQALLADIKERHPVDQSLTRDEASMLIANVVAATVEPSSTAYEIRQHLTDSLPEGAELKLVDIVASAKGPIDSAEQATSPDTANILTMHKAKGLTADVVFVVGAEDQYI